MKCCCSSYSTSQPRSSNAMSGRGSDPARFARQRRFVAAERSEQVAEQLQHFVWDHAAQRLFQVALVGQPRQTTPSSNWIPASLARLMNSISDLILMLLVCWLALSCAGAVASLRLISGTAKPDETTTFRGRLCRPLPRRTVTSE